MMLMKRVIGGLLTSESDELFRSVRRSSLPAEWKLPGRLDHRDEMLEYTDQGDDPICAAVTMTDLIERYRWQKTHIPIHIPPHPVYNRAKQLDGRPNVPGTTASAVFQAAIELGLISDKSKLRSYYSFDECCALIQEYQAVMLGLSIPQDWDAGDDGWVTGTDGAAGGGHMITACAYDIRTGERIFVGAQNHWLNFGAKGFCRIDRARFDKEFLCGAAIEIVVP